MHRWTSWTLLRLVGPMVIALLGAGVPALTVHAAAKPSCEYRVAKGDTLSHVARRHGVTEANLIRANPKLKKNPDRLKVGQTLEICRAKQLARSQPSKCGKGGRVVVHQVDRGETLGGIAQRYSVSIDAIKRYNKGLARRRNAMIRVGETLKVCTTSRRWTHRSWLSDGVQLPEGDGYHVRRPHQAWGTPLAVEAIVAAIARYRSKRPDAPLVQIGDISRQGGGPLGEHLSHQEGRDVDVGYVFVEDGDGRRTIDLAQSWALVASFAEDEAKIGAIFMDYALQRRMYDHALSEGVSRERLDAIFEYPRDGDREAIVYHWPGHDRHFHVRFRETAAETTPDSVATVSGPSSAFAPPKTPWLGRQPAVVPP